MNEEQYGRLIQWFETLSKRFDALEARMATGFASLQEQINELRELLSQQQDDLRIHARTIADHDRRLETVERR